MAIAWWLCKNIIKSECSRRLYFLSAKFTYSVLRLLTGQAIAVLIVCASIKRDVIIPSKRTNTSDGKALIFTRQFQIAFYHKTFYSARKLCTGFTRAAFRAWKLTVTIVISETASAAPRNIHKLNETG